MRTLMVIAALLVAAPTLANPASDGEGAPPSSIGEATTSERLPSYVANQEQRRGLGNHPNEPADYFFGEGLQAHAWTRVGYHVIAHGSSVAHGPYLSMARLQVRISDGERLSAFVHFGADEGELSLLDVKMRARLSDRVVLAVGRMKTPVSHDFMVPAAQMLLPTRALLDGLSPLRAVGIQGRYVVSGPQLASTLRVGVFDPLQPGTAQLAGPMAVVQGGLHSRSGFFVHAAGAAWLHGSALDLPDLLTHSPWDRQVDVAAGWSNTAWTFETEALLARSIDEARWDWGATALAAARRDLGKDFVIEGAVSGDIRDYEERFLRGTVALNLHEEGRHLMETLAWEVSAFGHGPFEHRILIQVQAGL